MKRIAFILSIIFVFSALISCSAKNSEYEYNTEINLNKPNGSISQMVDCEIMDVVGLTERADAIIYGKVANNGEAYSEPFISGETHEVALTKTKVKVNEVIYGEVPSNEIYYVQIGNPGDDSVTIKLKENEEVVLFVVYNEEHDYYCGISYEQSIFYVTEDGLYTNANVAELGKYDGTPLELLKRDIANIIEENNMTPENNLYARSASENEAE